MKNKYEIVDGCVHVFITYKNATHSMLIDKNDFDLVNGYKNTWKPNVKNNKIESVVNRIQIDGKRNHYKIHNILMNCPVDKIVDHINGNPLDNRRCNLRICTKAENSQNVHIKNSKTGIRNVTQSGNKFRVRINGTSYGCYDDLETAKRIADEQRPLHFILLDIKGAIND